MQGLLLIGPWLDRMSAAFGLNRRADFALRLCAEEAASNLVRHGVAAGAPDDIVLRLAAEPDHLRLIIEDGCASFDPGNAPPAEPGKLGGQGIHLMRQHAHTIDYERAGSLNRLIVTLRR
jgi:serine/threonine-protein kinase RsbW